MAFHFANLAPLAAYLPLLAMILLTINFGLHIDLRRRHRLAKRALDRVRTERNAALEAVFTLTAVKPLLLRAPTAVMPDEFRTHGADSAIDDEMTMQGALI